METGGAVGARERKAVMDRDGDVTRCVEAEPIPAGSFSTWLDSMERALLGDGGTAVPCGTCTGCCTSSQFILVEPDEVDTLTRIPADLLFPAPGLPTGNLLLGYDERGHCPMLVDDACTIYDDRPRTCRTYDCRIFPAAALEIDDPAQARIAERAHRWQFDLPDEVDRVEHAAVRAAATFVADHGDLLPDGIAPANATQHAVLAVRLHEAFLGPDHETGHTVLVDPEPTTVRRFITERRTRHPR